MEKLSSLLDYTYPGLNPLIWLQDGTLNPVHKDFVLKLLNSFYTNYNLKNSEQWVVDITIIGSLTTNKYLLNKSDFDCHVIVDIDKFIETNMPNASKEEAITYLDNARKTWDRAKILMPFTIGIILELYFESDLNPPNVEHVGRYSMLQNKWLKSPIYFEQDEDFEFSRKEAIEGAKELANELDDSFGEIGRQIQRIDELKEVLQAWPEEKRQLYYDKVQKKLDIIEEELEKSIQIKQDLVDQRHLKHDAFSDNEIQFKFLARFQYFSILQNLKTLLEQTGWQVTTQELPLIEKIISQGSQKQAGQVIDVNGAKIFKNPTWEQAENLYEASDKSHPNLRSNKHLRWVISPDTNELFLWDAYNANHTPVMEALGIEPNRENYENFAGDIVEFDDLDSVFSMWEDRQKVQPVASIKEAFLKEAFEKKILAIDFDDTIAHENSDRSIGEPEEGVKEALTKFHEDGYTLEIYSHRANTEEGADEIKKWLDARQIPYDSILHVDKPIATYYIDNRNIRFTSWADVMQQIGKSNKIASLIIAAALQTKYWIDPSGKEIPVPTKLGHYGWIQKNIFEQKSGKVTWVEQPVLEQKATEMIQEGWTRITTESDASADFAIEVANLKKLPSYLDDFIANHYTANGLELDDLNGDYIAVADPFPTIQRAVNRALLMQKNMQNNRVSKAFSKKEIIAQTKKVKQGDYSCLMALVPHDLAQEIVEWGVRNVPDDVLYLDEDGKLGRELESHITIKYGLLTNDAKYVRRSFNHEKPFKATLGKVRHFQPPELPFDVLTVEVVSEDLQKANKMVCDKFDCAKGLVSDEYKPHITIAYVKRDKAHEYVGFDGFKDKEVELDTVIFSPHKGNRTYFSMSNDKESSFILEQMNKFSSMDIGYWVDPNGRAYSVHGEGIIHNEWVLQNLEMLQDRYGLTIPSELFQESLDYWTAMEGDNVEDVQMPSSHEVWKQMIQTGWVRVGDSDEGIGLEVNDLRHIPSFMDNILAEDLRDGLMVRVEDINHVTVSVQYPFKSLQQAVNEALANPAKVAKKADFLPSLFQAPDNEWQFQHGGPDKEIALNPDSVSDETTWYAPCTEGKPRTKEVWRQFMSMFKNPFSKKEELTVDSEYDPVMDEKEKEEMGLDQTQLEYSKGFYDPKKHDFPHNTQWFQNYQGVQEPDKVTPVTYSPEMNPEFDKQNSPGGYPNRFCRKPESEWFSNEGEVNEFLIDMLKNREAAIDNITEDINKVALTRQYALYIGGRLAIRTLTRLKSLQIAKERFPEDYARGNYEIKREDFKVSSLDITAAYNHAYWLAPDGKVFTVRGASGHETSPKTTHWKWVSENAEMLARDYGIVPTEKHKGYGESVETTDLFNAGWIRVGDGYDADWGITVPDFHHIPSTLDNLLSQFASDGDKISLEDTGYKNFVRFEWPVKSIQQTVLQELRQPVMAKKAGDQSASVPDYLINEWKTDQINNDTDEEPYVNHDQRDYPYGMHDSPENTGYNIGWPKDNQPYVVRLDILENPAYRLDPFGIGEYNVTYYTAMPASDGIEATNPE